jgi:hypothetical protein
LTLDNVAAAYPPQLNIDPVQFDRAEAPHPGSWILHHHSAIHVADGDSERVEILEGLGPHENLGI